MDFEELSDMPDRLEAWVRDKLERTDGRTQLGTVVFDGDYKVLKQWAKTPSADELKEIIAREEERGHSLRIFDLHESSGNILLYLLDGSETPVWSSA